MLQTKIDETVEVIMRLFSEYVPGNGYKFQTLEAQANKMQIPRLQFINVVYLLLLNDYLDMPDDGSIANFIVLTDKGYDYNKGEEQLVLEVNFAKMIDFTKQTREKVFYCLWDYIGDGDKDTNPFYVTGPQFYNTIKGYIQALPPTYSEYMKFLEEKNGKKLSRSQWCKELFAAIPDNYIKSFLDKLSMLVNGKLQVVAKDREENDELALLLQSKETIMEKPNKIFISHCGGDSVAVDALVDLIGEIININSDNLFCSSVHGFDVMLGKNFMDNIMEQYNHNNLFLLYVLSHNYMGSPICLNEMGASWMTKKDNIGILLPGFDIDDLGNSCYDKQSVSVIFNKEDKEIRHRLNQLKEVVEKLFPDYVKSINPSRWEEKRDSFIAKIKEIPVVKKQDKLAEIEEALSIKVLDAKPRISIESDVYYRGKGSYVITFSNQGDIPAENLSVEFDEVDGIYIMLEKNMFPIEILKPGRSFQVNAIMMEGAPHKMMSYIRWNEEGKKFEEKELVLFNK